MPAWIEKYRPHDFSGMVGQDPVVERLTSWASSGNVPHLLLAGPHGTGKSVAVECLAHRLYGEVWEENTTVLPAAVIFGEGKAYLEAEERFAHIYQKGESVISNFKYIVKWYSSLRPLNATFKLMVCEEAADLPLDAQAALRRIMEQFSATCRFIYTTTNPSAIIPAITSRCFPLTFPPLSGEAVRSQLALIRASEGIPRTKITDDDLDLVVKTASGDLRKAIMLLQVLAESKTSVDLAQIAVSETATLASSCLQFLQKKDFSSARRTIESLIIDYGLTGSEVLAEFSRTARKEYNDPRLVLRIAEADRALVQDGSEFIQLNAFLAQVLEEVFS
ncbi:MAG: replication protein C [Methanomicrobiales archaeon]|nr:replication protein C [Methanomicrobiales archaeon]